MLATQDEKVRKPVNELEVYTADDLFNRMCQLHDRLQKQLFYQQERIEELESKVIELMRKR